MSATFNEISTKLSSKNPIVIIRKNINISNYYYIEDDFDNLNSYSLYICKLSNFPKDFKSDKIINFLIIVDVNIKYDLFQLKNCNILILEKDKISLYKLLEDLQDIININADIIASSNSIIDALSQNKNIDDIIKTIHHYLQNPIIITNSANYLCCHSDDNFDINDTIWEDYIKYGYPDPSYLEKIYYNIKFVQPLSTESDSHIIDYLDVMDHRVLTCPIKINNFNVAYIYVLEANKPFTKEDMRVLNILGKILAPSIINDPRFTYCENTQIDSIFYYLLSCDNTQPHFLEKTCEILNLEVYSNFFLLNINFSKEEMTIEKLKELYDLIKSVFFNQFVFIYKNQICILYITRDDNPNKFKIYSKYFLDICEKYNLSVGISDIFFNLHDIKIAYNQTLKALDYSTISAYKNRINYYSDFMLTDLVYEFLINENTDNIIDLNFKEFINSASEEYLKMMKLFVDNNGNLKKTADELHVHYNTLKYRLSKIRDEYCIDFEDLNYIIKLKLSYIALDFISNT